MKNKSVEVEYNKDYLIHNNGDVWSKKVEKFLKLKTINKIHVIDIAHTNPLKKSKTISINKLVYHHFVQKLDLFDDSYVISPIDGDYTNHSPNNLKKVTRKQHIHDLILSSDSSHPRGNFSTLKGKESDIYELYHTENKKLREIAEVYGVSEMSVHRALKRYSTTLTKYQ
jgi:hypothetical protein